MISVGSPNRQLGLGIGGALIAEETDESWLGSRVSRYRGTIDELTSVIPKFERRQFQTTNVATGAIATNASYETIVRLPTPAEPFEVPVGIVSPKYQLVQHRTVIERACAELTKAGIALAQVQAEARLTVGGERMSLSLTFPDEEKFSFVIADDDSMRVRLQCFNSVEGSTRFMLVFGWIRFVCLNGMIVGRPLTATRQAHTSLLDLDKTFRAVGTGITSAMHEAEQYRQWQGTPLSERATVVFADGPLQKKWGVQAAARVLSVCESGYDIKLDAFQKGPASQLAGERGERVPGSPTRARTVFDAAQALSWVAGQRREEAARLEALSDVKPLVTTLVKALSTWQD